MQSTGWCKTAAARGAKLARWTERRTESRLTPQALHMSAPWYLRQRGVLVVPQLAQTLQASVAATQALLSQKLGVCWLHSSRVASERPPDLRDWT